LLQVCEEEKSEFVLEGLLSVREVEARVSCYAFVREDQERAREERLAVRS